MSYNITGAESTMSVTKQATKAIDLKEDSVRYYKTDHSKILKRNDQKGPIVVHLDKREWATIQDEFGEAEWVVIFQLAGYCGMYILSTFQATTNQCLLKSRTQKRLNVSECMTNGYLRFFHNIVLYCKMFVCMFVCSCAGSL